MEGSIGRIPEQVVRVANAVFEGATAIAFFCVALAFFTSGGESLVRSPVGQSVFPYDYAWNLFYLTAGPAILTGLAVPHRRVEMAGLVALAWGLVANAIALAALSPDWRLGGYSAFAVACLVRVRKLARR